MYFESESYLLFRYCKKLWPAINFVKKIRLSVKFRIEWCLMTYGFSRLRIFERYFDAIFHEAMYFWTFYKMKKKILENIDF